MKNLEGTLLISPPNVRDSFWEKTVIMVTEDLKSKGTVGLVLNKPSRMTINEFALHNGVDVDIPGFVHIGGPVNTKALCMLHTNDWSCSNTLRVNQYVSISSSPEILTKMAMKKLPSNWRIFLGLCGWPSGQLPNEIAGTPPYTHSLSWLTANSNLNITFDQNGSEQWMEAIELSGSELVNRMLA